MDQVLPIYECENFDPEEFCGDITLLSAEQYIYWVRYQACKMPDFLRADVDTNKFLGRQTPYMPSIDSILGCSDFYSPTLEWENSVAAKFSELRTILGCYGARGSSKRDHVVPPMRDQAAWHLFCLGKDLVDDQSIYSDDNDQSYQEIAEDEDEENFEIATDLSELTKRKLLLYEALDNVDNLELVTSSISKTIKSDDNHKESALNADLSEDTTCIAQLNESNTNSMSYGVGIPPLTSLVLQFDQVMTQRILAHHAEWLDDADNLSPLSAMWIYALLARLEKPLFQDTEAVIRGIYRRCCALRATLEKNENKSEQVENNSYDHNNKNNNIKSEIQSSVGVNQQVTSNNNNNNLLEENQSNNNNSINETELASLNILIIICGSYFGQGESSIATASDTNNSNNSKMVVGNQYNSTDRNKIIDNNSNSNEQDEGNEFGEFLEQDDLTENQEYYDY